MKNKGFVIVLTVIVSALCLYYLSFTFVSRNVQQDAIAFATDESGIVNLGKKQSYIDSIWNKPVYNLFGAEFTYKEVKDNELSLGLDLQGGMHVTLEISPIDIIKALSGNSPDSAFHRALNTARQAQKTSQRSFNDLFFEAFRQQNPDRPLRSIFANAATRGRITVNDSDDKVIEVINGEIESAIDRSYTILRNRLDQFGTSQPNIQRLPNSGRIQIEIPGADNPQRVRKLLQGVAKLEFWELADMSSLNSSFIAINDFLVKEQRAQAATKNNTQVPQIREPQDGGELQQMLAQDSAASELEKQLSGDSVARGLDSLRNFNISPLFALSNPPGTFRYSLRDTATINNILRRPEVRSMLPRNIMTFWANKPERDQNRVEGLELFFINSGRGQAKITGEVINDARSTTDEFGRPAVSMTMNAAGNRVWARMTEEAANKNPKGRIAIVLDNTVYSAPSVTGAIPNGNSQISGSFTPEEAKDLANVLKAGSLPAPTKIVEEAIVGPTLGEVARNQGLTSMACGLGIVVLFMFVYYSRSGAVANIALIFNIFFILGILAQLSASLTLPGIAGIVLTIGMAVDANVLIFERIKEEMLNGRKLLDAINTGYKKAFSSIFDSNVTTFLTAVFLFVLGQGPLKGFAVVLMIGIATSFFTAVYVSRVFVEWMVRRGDSSKFSFSTPLANAVRKRKQYDFISMRKVSYIVSVAIIAIGFGAMAFKGLNLGVDFKGGRSYVVSFPTPVVATNMKVALSQNFENASTEVKNYGANNVVKVTTSYLIDDDSDTADERVKQQLVDGLQTFSGLRFTEDIGQLPSDAFTISQSSKVGATVADDIKDSAFQASIFSVIGIFLYILIRFRKWQFSVGAILATVHDALFVIASFSIMGLLGVSFEIDQVFVAALLTVIGYSINDTVIIYDRIRENLGLGTSHDRLKLFNSAINATLGRTLITSGTTLVVVIVLLLFGGEVLRGFAFALFIGILVGTFSSIFVAAPVVLDMDKDESKPVEQKKPKPAVA